MRGLAMRHRSGGMAIANACPTEKDMDDTLFRRAASAVAAVLFGLLASCGGGGGAGGGSSLVPAISSPAEGATFRAGDTLQFAGSATDAQGAAIAAAGLTWW